MRKYLSIPSYWDDGATPLSPAAGVSGGLLAYASWPLSALSFQGGHPMYSSIPITGSPFKHLSNIYSKLDAISGAFGMTCRREYDIKEPN